MKVILLWWKASSALPISHLWEIILHNAGCPLGYLNSTTDKVKLLVRVQVQYKIINVHGIGDILPVIDPAPLTWIRATGGILYMPSRLQCYCQIWCHNTDGKENTPKKTWGPNVSMKCSHQYPTESSVDLKSGKVVHRRSTKGGRLFRQNQYTLPKVLFLV